MNDLTAASWILAGAYVVGKVADAVKEIRRAKLQAGAELAAWRDGFERGKRRAERE